MVKAALQPKTQSRGLLRKQSILQHPLDELVDHFTPGGCYGIEWELSGDKLKYKTHFCPQWRIDGVKAKGLKGGYTEKSMNFEFSVGQGFVGRTFELQEVLFVEDLQKLDATEIQDAMHGDGREFQRAGLAKEFDLRSAIFIPSPWGVFEIGSSAIVSEMPLYYAPYVGPATPTLSQTTRVYPEMTKGPEPPTLLPKLVDELTCAGSYGIEWVWCGDVLKCRSHYNPAWRIEGVRRSGLKDVYTTESSTFTFEMGESLVGGAFADQVVIFEKDVQTPGGDCLMAAMQTGSTVVFQRADIARAFGIHSAVFLPSADGVLEIGSTQQAESLQKFVTEATWAAIAGKTDAVDILSALSALAA